MSQQTAASYHKLNDECLLGDEIGKGACGRVYKGLDLENGDFVAIRQTPLENIPPEDLASIQQEIDLLKNPWWPYTLPSDKGTGRLVYLHEQGVIHRDVKGAYIFMKKEGLVKFADFGVTTRLTERDVNEHFVVWTPYWLAPEVIEMWRVSYTVVELLTCMPPYYDLQPMAALFDIVKDDHPPLPEHTSPATTDFLRQCFTKDAKRRPGPRTLLKHP